jgi:cobalamin biosynthesis protein CobD/CbiB
MAAMAGLLGVRLEKHGHYALGDASRLIEAEDITRAWSIVARAGWAMTALCSVLLFAWERHHG